MPTIYAPEISRFFGGTNYMYAIYKGNMQGKEVERKLLQKLILNK